MLNSDFIKYINSLHNASAGNENAIAESQFGNPYYQQIEVDRPVGMFLINQIKNEKPCTIILTGHAGDGKTTLLAQVLQGLKCVEADKKMECYETVDIPDGDRLLYIKDFSELSCEDRRSLLRESLDVTLNNQHAILVANTGPLLNTLQELLGSEAKNLIIKSMDSNEAEVFEIGQYRILVLNIAKIDNTAYIRPFMNNLISNSNWEKCEECSKCDKCPIFFNHRIVKENSERIIEFITNHYIWQEAHGCRLTIRQINAHLAFSFTGGLSCTEVKNSLSSDAKYKYLFSNLLFGYKELEPDLKANNIRAIREIRNICYDKKKLSVDLDVFTMRNFSGLSPLLRTFAYDSGKKNLYNLKWQQMIKRMYIVFNIETDDLKVKILLSDLFSDQFQRYLDFRSGKKPNQSDKRLILNALAKLSTGSQDAYQDKIYLTMRREGSVLQSVQLIYGIVNSHDLKVEIKKTSRCFNNEQPIHSLELKVLNKQIDCSITLPLLNYFSDVCRGIITTNIDPQLSYGIDSIKAQILAIFIENESDDVMKLLMLSGGRWSVKEFIKEDGHWSVQ